MKFPMWLPYRMCSAFRMDWCWNPHFSVSPNCSHIVPPKWPVAHETACQEMRFLSLNSHCNGHDCMCGWRALLWLPVGTWRSQTQPAAWQQLHRHICSGISGKWEVGRLGWKTGQQVEWRFGKYSYRLLVQQYKLYLLCNFVPVT